MWSASTKRLPTLVLDFKIQAFRDVKQCTCSSVVYVTTLSVYQDIMFIVGLRVDEQIGRVSVIGHCLVCVLSRHLAEGAEEDHD